MKKLTFLFAFLCASVMGWADTELVDYSQMTLDSWGPSSSPTVVKDAENERVTVTLNVNGPGWQWGGQAKIVLTNVATNGLDVNKEYKLSFTATASTDDCGGVTLKFFDDNQLYYANQNLSFSTTPYDFETEWIRPNSAGTNGTIVFDFGHDPAQIVTISNLSFQEREPAPKASECSGSRGHEGGTPHLDFEISYDGTTTTLTATPKASGVQFDFFQINVNGSISDLMGGESTKSSVEYTTTAAENTELYIAFLYSPTDFGGNYQTTGAFLANANDPNIIYYKVGDCATSGAANPHLALTNPTQSSVLLPKGESITVAYTSENSAAATIESNNACVSVSGNVVTAESTGTATITVSQAEVAGTWNEASTSFEVTAFDWDDVSFIATSDYKIKSSLPGLSLDNAIINWKGHNSIHLILPDAVGIDCSLTGNFDIEGAGLFIYTDAFTVRQTPFTISWHGNVYDTYVYYNLDETPPTISNVEVTSYNHQQAVITITANEAFVSAEVFNNGVSMGTFTPTAGAITLTGLTASTLYDQLTVKVKDAANNVSASANVPEFTTAAPPTITPVTYNGYGVNKGVYALYSITRNSDQSLKFSVKVDAAFGFNKRVHYYKAGIADVWADLVYNSGSDTYDYTAAAGLFVDGEEWVAEFYFPFTGDAASIVCNYTIGSAQDAPANIPVSVVQLNKAATMLSVGETDNLTATVYPSFATSANTVTWASTATAYATVDAGTVTAVADGSANITATCGGVTSSPCAVTVVGVLEPVTYWGNGANNGVAIAYSITRNANHTLTYTVEAQQDKAGFYVRVNDGEYHTASLNEGIYSWTSEDPYADGTVLNGFIYMPYTGGDARVDFSYTVGSESARRYIPMTVVENADNASVLAANDGKVREVTVARSFTAGSLYTLVLPFDADAALTAEKFPGQLTKLNNTIEKDNGDLKVNFVDVDAIEAGVPYLYEPSANVANPIFGSVTIHKDLNPTEPADGKAKYYGIYAPTTGADLKLIDNAYVLGSDQYLYAATGLNDNQPMKALRGYFVLNFPSTSSAAPKRIAQVVFNSNEVEATTGFESIRTSVGR